MNTFYNQMTVRNIGIFTPEEQNKLKNCCVAIAGVGGVGGLLAERLIRIGVGKLCITDPGTFEPTNFNRQFGSTTKTIDTNKAEAVYAELHEINPYADIDYDIHGIRSQEDAFRLVEKADIVVDEMDFPMLKESIYLQRAARKKGIFYMFSAALGFGCVATIFSPEGYTLEEYNGIPRDMDLAQFEPGRISMDKVTSRLPSYVFDGMNHEKLGQMMEGKEPISTNSIGVGLTSILTANETVNVLLQKKPIITAPNYIHIDLLDRVYSILSN